MNRRSFFRTVLLASAAVAAGPLLLANGETKFTKPALEQIKDLGWEVHFEQRAYLMEGFAWTHKVRGNVTVRFVTPLFVKEIPNEGLESLSNHMAAVILDTIEEAERKFNEDPSSWDYVFAEPTFS